MSLGRGRLWTAPGCTTPRLSLDSGARLSSLSMMLVCTHYRELRSARRRSCVWKRWRRGCRLRIWWPLPTEKATRRTLCSSKRPQTELAEALLEVTSIPLQDRFPRAAWGQGAGAASCPETCASLLAHVPSSRGSGSCGASRGSPADRAWRQCSGGLSGNGATRLWCACQLWARAVWRIAVDLPRRASQGRWPAGWCAWQATSC